MPVCKPTLYEYVLIISDALRFKSFCISKTFSYPTYIILPTRIIRRITNVGRIHGRSI